MSVGTFFVGVKVVAAKFESADAEDAIIDFYRNEMRTYGTVVECRGDVDFKGPRGVKQPVCNEKRSSESRQLVVGPEERQRIVSVKPRGSGSEFAIVFVQTRE